MPRRHRRLRREAERMPRARTRAQLRSASAATTTSSSRARSTSTSSPRRPAWPHAGRAACSPRRSSSSWPQLSPKGERAGVSLFHGSIRDPVWEYVLTADVAEASLRGPDDGSRARRPQPRAARAGPGQGGPRGRQGRARPGSHAGRQAAAQPRDRSGSRATATRARPGCCSTPRRSRRASCAASTRSSGAQSDIRAAGLPARLADRLSRGL